MLGAVFILAGIGVLAAGFLNLVPAVPAGVMIGLGLVLCLLGLVFGALNLYRKTAANEALVKTGMGGPHVVLDGGLFYFPMMQHLVQVSLETMKLEVERMGSDA